MDISKSSTAHWQHCNEVTRNEECQCSKDNRCKYSETYSEGATDCRTFCFPKGRSDQCYFADLSRRGCTCILIQLSLKKVGEVTVLLQSILFVNCNSL